MANSPVFGGHFDVFQRFGPRFSVGRSIVLPVLAFALVLLWPTASACVPGSYEIPLAGAAPLPPGPDPFHDDGKGKQGIPNLGAPLAIVAVVLAVLLAVRGRAGGPRAFGVLVMLLLPIGLLMVHPIATAQSAGDPGLYLDMDNSGSTNPNDLRLLSRAGYVAGSMVRTSDTDASATLGFRSPRFQNLRFIDDNANGTRDLNEPVYLTVGNARASAGDVRLTQAYGFSGGTSVRGGDTDTLREALGTGTAKYGYLDGTGNGRYDSSDVVFLHFGTLNYVYIGDIALSGGQAFRVVDASNSNLGTILTFTGMPNIGDEQVITARSPTPTTGATTPPPTTTPPTTSSIPTATTVPTPTPTSARADGSKSPQVFASLFLEATTVASGTALNVHSWAGNAGSLPAKTVRLTISINGDERQTSLHSNLLPENSTETQQFEAFFSNPGWYEIKAKATYAWTDGLGRDQESKHETTERIYVFDPARPTLPNLIIETASLREDPEDGRTHAFATVRNAGTLESTTTGILFAFLGMDHHDATMAVPALAAGETTEIKGPVVAGDVEGRTIRIQADPSEALRETSETDNVLDLPIPAARLRVTVESIWASKDEHVPHEPVRVFARIMNDGDALVEGLVARFVVDGKEAAEHALPALEVGQSFTFLDDVVPASGAVDVAVMVKEGPKELATAKLQIPAADLAPHVKLIRLCGMKADTDGWVQLVAQVANTGATASKGGTVSFLLDARPFGVAAIPRLGPYEEAELASLPWLMEGTLHTLTLKVEADGQTVASLATPFDVRELLKGLTAVHTAGPTFSEVPNAR